MNCSSLSWSALKDTVSTVQKNFTLGSTTLLCSEIYALIHVGRSLADIAVSPKVVTNVEAEFYKLPYAFGRFFISSSVVVGIAPYINHLVFGDENSRFHVGCAVAITGLSFLKTAYQISR